MEKSKTLPDLTQHACRNQLLPFRQVEGLEHGQRIAHGQIHIFGNSAAFHAYSQALRLEPLTMTGRTLTEGSVWLELLLHDPRPLFVPTTQVGDQPLESLT